MKTERMFVLAALLLTLTLACPALHGQEVKTSSDGWEFEVIPYVWGLTFETDVKVAGVERTLIDMDFGDILNDFQFGAMGALQARKLPWILFLDGMYAELRDSGTKNGIHLDGGVDMAFLNFGAAYRMGDPEFSFDILAGGRYTYTKTKLSIDSGPTVSQSDDFLVPFVGAQLNADLSEKWFLALRGEVGSFGVEADIDWGAIAYVGYRLGSWGDLRLGYRYFESETNSGAVEIKPKLHGPIVGLGIKF